MFCLGAGAAFHLHRVHWTKMCYMTYKLTHDEQPHATNTSCAATDAARARAVPPVPGIHVGCGLVNDEDAVLPQDGSGQTDQLSLTNTEVGARLGQNCLQLGRKLLHHRP